MKINHSLNLVMRHENDAGDTIFIHALPLSTDIFRENFIILSKTYAAIFGEGLGVISGPGIAYLMLEKVAKDAGVWDGASGVKNTLVNHIVNGCTAIMPVEDGGWQSVPLEVAIKNGAVSLDEVMGEIVFFICICGVNKKNQVPALLKVLCGLWGSSVTSWDVTGYLNSLKTSPKEEVTGEKPEEVACSGGEVSSIPS